MKIRLICIKSKTSRSTVIISTAQIKSCGFAHALPRTSSINTLHSHTISNQNQQQARQQCKIPRHLTSTITNNHLIIIIMLLLHYELLALVIIIATSSNNVAAASSSSTSDHHLRGSGDVANFVEEAPSSTLDKEERQLKRGDGDGGGKGKNNHQQTTTTTTTTTTTVAPLPLPLAGGAEAPEEPADGTTTAPTPTPIPAVCDPLCDKQEVCAHPYPGAAAQCYPKCSGFPLTGNCTELCVSTTFNCGGYASVFNEFCECDVSGYYADSCRTSECGLAAP